jgi:tol-pal system protein YbgF
MRIRNVVLSSALLTLTLLPAQSAFGVSKEIVQLQTQVQDLQDQMTKMSTSFNERMGVMRNLLEQSTDNMNKVTQQIDNLTRTLQQQQTDAGGRTDQVSGQIQSLHDSVDELKARVAAISKKLDDMAQQSQNLNNTAAAGSPAGSGPATGPAQPPVNQAPPADVLYNNALRDYNSAKYDLASGEFADFMKFYADNDLAGNAQFYIADIEYRQGNFDAAVKDYDKVLEQYPSGNKAPAAQLKKGFALLELGQRDAGVRELRSLVNRYPRSIEAQQARDRLARLSPGTTTKKKPS